MDLKPQDSKARNKSETPQKLRKKINSRKSSSKKTKDTRPPSKSQRASEAVPEEPNASFPIVGIGASAGGLEAFRQLLEDLPTDTGMAFVLGSHLDPTHKTIPAELLGRRTKVPGAHGSAGIRAERTDGYVL